MTFKMRLRTYVITRIGTYIVKRIILRLAIRTLDFQLRPPIPKERINLLSQKLLPFFFRTSIELFHDPIQLLSFMDNAFAKFRSLELKIEESEAFTRIIESCRFGFIAIF